MIQEVRRALKFARETGDVEAAATLLVDLLIALMDLRYLPRLDSLLRDYRSDVRAILRREDVTSDILTNRFQQFANSLDREFAALLDEAGSEIWENEFENVFAAEAAVLAQAFGGNFDAEQNPIPAPSAVSESTTEGMSLEEILLIAAPILFLLGDKALKREALREQWGEPPQTLIPEQWRRYLVNFLQQLNPFSRAAAGASLAQDGDVRQAETIVLADMEDEGVFYRQLRTNLTRNVGDTRRNIEDHLQQNQLNRVYVGWMLKSAFLPTTSAEHANRDGTRYFFDNRPQEVQYPANLLFRAPYEYPQNCQCTNVPLYDSGDAERTTSLQIEGLPEIAARNLASWSDWFGVQPPRVQQTIIGDRRFFAALSQGTGRVTWYDVSDGEGRLLSANRLSRESRQQAGDRAAAARQFAELQNSRNLEAWQNDLWRLSPREEAAYRRRLRSYLRRVIGE